MKVEIEDFIQHDIIMQLIRRKAISVDLDINTDAYVVTIDGDILVDIFKPEQDFGKDVTVRVTSAWKTFKQKFNLAFAGYEEV